MAFHTYTITPMNNKELAIEWFEAVWNRKDSQAISRLMDSSIEGITEAGDFKGPEGFKTLMFDPFLRAFPDVKVTIDACIAEGDEAAVKWTATGTHSGPLMDIAATGRRVSFSGISWIRCRDGRIVRGSDSYNLHGLVAFLSHGTSSTSVKPA